MEDIQNYSIEELADLVIKGEFGNGLERKTKLGDLFQIVQNKVNEKLYSNIRIKLNEKSIEILAYRVLEGEFGNGNNRKKKLGYAYIEVQNKVNEILGCPKRLTIEEEKTIEEYAKEVIKGINENEEDIKKRLGDLYPIVQNRVNEILGKSFRYEIDAKSIEIYAQRVIKGEFGNGEERKKKLGQLYNVVQNKVNEILKCPIRLES